jgi:hypothetical protein
MKNIHILPTDKPSRLVKQKYDEFNRLCLADMETKRAEYKRFNLYITSNEEIKEGIDQWYLDKVINEPYNSGGAQYSSKQDVIILTTDQELIKDGVQDIDNEFLEWFVKNPSCERVEVIHWEGYSDIGLLNYEIIIPKEEQKQHIIDIMKQDEELGLYEQTKCYCGHTTTCDCGPEQEITLEDIFNEEKRQGVKELIDKHKQETLEDIKLEEVLGSSNCLYTVIENKLATIYRNQEKILIAIKLLNNEKRNT